MHRRKSRGCVHFTKAAEKRNRWERGEKNEVTNDGGANERASDKMVLYAFEWRFPLGILGYRRGKRRCGGDIHRGKVKASDRARMGKYE